MHSSFAPNTLHINPPTTTTTITGKNSTIPMATTTKIIRKSLHTFLQHYHYYTAAAIAALPFSAAALLSTALPPDSLRLHPRLRSLFAAAGFPPESEFFSILNLKLSQTISSCVLLLPFTLSFLMITKSILIQSLNTHRNPTPSLAGILNSVVTTQICNTMLIISFNATCFWVFFITISCLQNLNIPSLFFTISGGITYSVVFANAVIICNLALIISGMEFNSGFISILKACVLIRGKTSIALLLSLPVNMVFAGIELLFRYRIIKNYSEPTSIMILEGLFIAYLYSVVIVIDVIIGCVFFKSCKIAYDRRIVDQEAGGINEEDEVALVKFLEKDFS